jgi:alanyl-tRNA synthetase
LCGGTHVHTTSEVGLFKLTGESSSAANVRRIEALTGPAAVRLMRDHDDELGRAARVLRVTAMNVSEAAASLNDRVRELERAKRQGGSGGNGAVDVDRLASAAQTVDGANVLAAAVEGVDDAQMLLQISDKLKAKLGDAAIVLGSAGEGRVDLVASVAPALVARGVRAGEIIKVAAAEVGGGGGGRDTLARAGGRDAARLPDAIDAARKAIESALTR